MLRRNMMAFSGGGGGGTAFRDALLATSPQILILPVDTAANPGDAATNSGSYAGSGISFASDVLYNQGALNTGSVSNSVANVAGHVVQLNTTAVNAAGITDTAGAWYGYIGTEYRGTGAGTGTARIPFRQAGVNQYVRIDTTNIQLRLPSGTYDTGVLSSTVKDDEPHYFDIVRLASGGGVTLYLDGSSIYNVPAGTMSLVTGASFQWGRNNNNPENLYGKYGTMVICKSSTLTQSDIDAIHSAWSPAP